MISGQGTETQRQNLHLVFGWTRAVMPLTCCSSQPCLVNLWGCCCLAPPERFSLRRANRRALLELKASPCMARSGAWHYAPCETYMSYGHSKTHIGKIFQPLILPSLISSSSFRGPFQDTSKQAQMRATEGSCLLTQQGRGSIRDLAAEFRQCIMEEHGVASPFSPRFSPRFPEQFTWNHQRLRRWRATPCLFGPSLCWCSRSESTGANQVNRIVRMIEFQWESIFLYFNIFFCVFWIILEDLVLWLLWLAWLLWLLLAMCRFATPYLESWTQGGCRPLWSLCQALFMEKDVSIVPMFRTKSCL